MNRENKEIYSFNYQSTLLRGNLTMTARICKLKGKLPKKVYDRMMKQYKRETKDIIRIRDLYSGGSIAIVYVFKDTK